MIAEMGGSSLFSIKEPATREPVRTAARAGTCARILLTALSSCTTLAILAVALPTVVSTTAAEAANTRSSAHARVAPPLGEGMPSVRAPRPKEATLDNGLRVLMVERYSDVPTFMAQLVFPDSGGLYEPPHRRGVAAFTADMLREGTAGRSGQDIARQLETLGATLEADAPLAASAGTVTVTAPSVNLGQVLDLLADIVRNPAFREQEVARHAARTLAELELKRARPEFVAQEQLQRAIYGHHLAGDLAPSVEAIGAIRREDLERFHAKHYRPNAAVLVVVGSGALDEALPQVKRAFGDWQRRDVAVPAFAPVGRQQASAIRLVDRPGSVQTVFQIGVLGITRKDPDFFALQAMNEIVGGQSSARLYQNLRARHGYTYGAYSGFSAAHVPGLWQVTTSVRTEVTKPALEEILFELRRIVEQPVSAEELAASRRSLAGKYIFALERPQRVVENIVTQVLYGLPSDYWDTYLNGVTAVTAADIQRIAKRIVDLSTLQIAAVGDGTKIRSVLAGFGTLRGADDAPAPPVPSAGASPAHAAPIFSENERARLGQTIREIADDLIASAVQKPTGIAWANRSEEGKSEETLSVYDGSPGVAYFLLKAYETLGEEGHRVAAGRALTYLLSQGKRDAHGLYFDARINGVFEGNAGPGYVFLYAHHVTGDVRWLEAAQATARRIVAVPDIESASSPDIISGAAGTGLYLLAMHRVTRNEEYLRGARRLGDFLLERAEPREAGVTWKLTAPPGAPQPEYYFVGFSHGPAGIAYFLDLLAGASGEKSYAAMAERAMAHIEAIAIREYGFVKWYHEELKRKSRYSSQWCHGAPGMNPFFLERHARTSERKYLSWAAQSTEYLLDQGVNIRQNAGVCHGVTGNAASLVQLYGRTGNADYRVTIRAAVDLLYDTQNLGANGFWHLGQGLDYGYMNGLAGIGDFFVLVYSEGRLSMFGPLGYGDDLAVPSARARRSRAAT